MSEQWPRPIPVTERLPDVGERVLGWLPIHGREQPDNEIASEGLWSEVSWQGQTTVDVNDTWNGGIPSLWVDDGQGECHITHWLPLPPPIKG